jgi:hypothetical protein
MGAGIGKRTDLAGLTAGEQHRHTIDLCRVKLVALQFGGIEHRDKRPGHGLADSAVDPDPKRETELAPQVGSRRAGHEAQTAQAARQSAPSRMTIGERSRAQREPENVHERMHHGDPPALANKVAQVV